MNKVVMVAVSLALSTSAFAGKPKPPSQDINVKQEQKSISISHSDSFSKSNSFSASKSNAVANSNSDSNANAVSYSEGSESFSSADNVGNSQTIAINSIHPDDIKIKNTPNLSLGGIYPAGACFKPVEAALSLAGGAIGGGRVFVDEVCQTLEHVRMGFQIGMRDAAIYEWCNMPQAEGNPHCMNSKQWEDYNIEVALLKADNEAFLTQFEEMHEENTQLREEVERVRLQKATTK